MSSYTQKYRKGQLVIVESLPKCMSHFKTGRAIVDYSYVDKYSRMIMGGADSTMEPTYCLNFINEQGEIISSSSWYQESIIKMVDCQVRKLRYEGFDDA